MNHKSSKHSPTMQTIAFSSHYFKQQLNEISDDWVLLAASADAYKILIPLCKDLKLLVLTIPVAGQKRRFKQQ
ncbi:hypothetical protein ACSU64_04370 [Bacillaceae bacterium C204]|uniref:hypothetical protein n=1 Tax=Neobacillus sp. 204 TaxID=3383351 RepID=UPI003979A434